MTDSSTGVLPSQALERMIASGAIRARAPILPEQIQPSSLDLRLGAEDQLAGDAGAVDLGFEQKYFHEVISVSKSFS